MFLNSGSAFYVQLTWITRVTKVKIKKCHLSGSLSCTVPCSGYSLLCDLFLASMGMWGSGGKGSVTLGSEPVCVWIRTEIASSVFTILIIWVSAHEYDDVG